MSAPDPKAWALTEGEKDAIECNLDIYGIESEELQGQIYAVARRRALAELRALSALAEHVGGDSWSEWMVDRSAIDNRIAAIEAEEATPPSASE